MNCSKLILLLFSFIFSISLSAEITKRKKKKKTETAYNFVLELKKVDSLVNIVDQPETAQILLNNIKQKAQFEKQKGYYIRCIQTQYILNNNAKEADDTFNLNWKLIQSEIALGSEDMRSFLYVDAAHYLKDIYQQNRWQSDRIFDDKSTNPNNWSIEKLNEVINISVDSALYYSKNVEDNIIYEPLISYFKGYDFKLNVYQILIRSAIDLLNDLKISYSKDYKMPEAKDALSPANQFIIKNFVVSSDPKNEYKRLILYQKLLNSLNKDPNAFIYFDRERLNTLRNLYPIETKYFLDALIYLKTINPFNPYNNLVAEELAKFYQNPDPVKSISILSEAIKDHPGFVNENALLDIKRSIENQTVSVQIEKVNQPARKILARVDYTNLNAVYVTAYKVNYIDYLEQTSYRYGFKNRNVLDYLDSLKAYASNYKINLPLYQDYKSHSSEVALDSLPIGTYIILVSNIENLKDKEVRIAFGMLAVVPYTIIENDEKIYLLDAENGKTYPNETYQIFEDNQFRNNGNKGRYEKILEGITDVNGLIDLSKISNEKGFRSLIIEIGHQHLYESKYLNLGQREGNESQLPQKVFKVITDRSIYRPGQRVFFKCIAYDSKNKKTLSNEKLNINLTDNNRQEISKLTLVTNAYGSVSGSFSLPKGEFNTGDFNINVNDNFNISFKVEEYKRPKYTAKFLVPETAYKLNDDVTIIGEAKAFAGYAIQDAKVVYNVTRILNQRWWNEWSNDINGESNLTLMTGETVTDKEGKFSVRFKALPQENTSEKMNPYFRFEISAIVTDLNGEVKICQLILNMAYTDQQLSISGNNENWLGSPVTLNYSCTNLQNKPLAFTGTIQIEKIIKSLQVLRTRLWEKTDTTALNEKEFNTWFPSYEYLNKPAIFKTILTRTFNKDTLKDLVLMPSEVNEAGTYKASINTIDSRGITIVSTFQFMVLPKFAGIYQLPEPLNIQCINGSTFQPKDLARLLVSTGAKNARILLTIKSKRGILIQKELLLSQSSQIIDLPITVEDRGNIEATAYMVNDFRLYTANTIIDVPYTNKELSLQLSSYRDEVEPGAKEKWIIKLKGPASEKAIMESVAVMYDQSLDAIYENANWRLWIFDNYYQYNVTSGSFENIIFNQFENEDYSFEYRQEYEFKVPAYYYRDHYSGSFKPLRCPDFGGEADGRNEKVNMRNLERGSRSSNYKKNEDISYRWNIEDSVIINPKVLMPSIRKNFEETAFFYPHLYANAKGEISMEFTMPEALTQWKMRMLAHSVTMQTGYLEHSITTSKKIMVQPNLPRFLRQGDKITIASKIVNNTSKPITAKVSFTLKDEITGVLLNWLTDKSEKNIQVPANSSSPVSFTLKIPAFTGVVTLAITGVSGYFSDGEQHTLPVLSNRQLITESLPLTIRKSGAQILEFSHLKNNNSKSLTHEKLTVEMSNNPAWYAIQALPYMMEFPYECAEQIFTRLYANSLALFLANSYPEIKKVYSEWEIKASTGNSLQSKLQKNEDLKSTLIEETPWLYDANNETERMQKLGVLFNHVKMTEALSTDIEKLKQMQFENGAFGWFKGMQANTYITQTIVVGFGKMQKIGIDISIYKNIIEKAIGYLDEEAKRDYIYYHTLKDFKNFHPNNLQYLYCKSYFPQIGLANSDSFVQYFIKNSEYNWIENSLLNRAQLATAIQILNPESNLPVTILKSFNETAKQNDEMGMYWPKNSGGWYWYESPIETQAAIMELYLKIGNEKTALKEQQIWLLRQKQTQNWKTTRSTADACYALIMNGNFLNNKQDVEVKVNNVIISTDKKEAGTGYYRKDIPKETITSNSGNITVKASTSDFAYGAIYWQYFEQMDKIQSTGSGLSISKKIFKIINTSKGTDKIEVIDGTLMVGDLIEVSLNIRSDRNLEYVHIKDLRGTGTEPVEVLSSYFWQNGLGYYKSTKDASTNFFIDYLSKGNYQLNYTLKIEQAGKFENGIATAQCMYAPEYVANSAGLMLEVK